MSNFYLKGRIIFNINTEEFWNNHSTFIPADGEKVLIKKSDGTIVEKLGDGNTKILELPDYSNGGNHAISFDNYEAMITALNSAAATDYHIAQNIMIVTLEVPDLWVSGIASTPFIYSYETDEEITYNLKSLGKIQVGYFILSALETQKVDLSEYLAKDTTTGKSLAYTNHNGQTQMREIAAAMTSDISYNIGRIPTYRDPYGVGIANLTTGTPGGDFSCTNKKYVDDIAVTKLNFPTAAADIGETVRIAAMNSSATDPQQMWIRFNPTYIYSIEEYSSLVPAYRVAGRAFANSETELAKLKNTIFVAKPILNYEAANKKYVDDKITEINISSGEGESSVQLKQDNPTITLINGLKVKTVSDTGAKGIASINLSTQGFTNRNKYLNVGTLNIIDYNDKETPYDELDDGGIIAGYKNINKGRNNNIFGAWNTILNVKQGLISGYWNTMQGELDETNTAENDYGNNAIIGTENFIYGKGIRESLYCGRGLTNDYNTPFHYVVGTWNKVDIAENYLNENGNYPRKNIRFSVGNGTGVFSWKKLSIKPTFEEAKKNNHKFKYNPTEEEWLYIKVGDNYLPVFDEDDVDTSMLTIATEEQYNDATEVYKKYYARSNAFYVTYDGRASLCRQSTVTKDILQNDDLLTKKEIEDIVANSSGGVEVDSELSTESENPVQNKVITEALDGKVTQSTNNTGLQVYIRDNGVEKTRPLMAGALTNNNGNLSGYIPVYRRLVEGGSSELTTGTPSGDFSCVNLKYFNENKGTKLYKHTRTINFMAELDGEIAPDRFTVSCVTNRTDPLIDIYEDTSESDPISTRLKFLYGEIIQSLFNGTNNADIVINPYVIDNYFEDAEELYLIGNLSYGFTDKIQNFISKLQYEGLTITDFTIEEETVVAI